MNQSQESPTTPPDREREARAVANKIVVRSCAGYYGSKGGCVQSLEFLEGEITAALLQARRAAYEEAAKVAENEPELEGQMPMEVWAALNALPLDEQQRMAVRATKKSIAAAIRQRGKNLTQ